MNQLSNSPLDSLRSHQWFKLICGASYQHLPSIRNLALVYTLAGADCIDMAADPAVIRAAREGISVAHGCMGLVDRAPDNTIAAPWVMVSFNDGEDPHFRKALFEPQDCLSGCDRPCVDICPTQAIQFRGGSDRNIHSPIENGYNGIVDSLCYGCGRCLPLCPVQIIHTREQVYAPETIHREPIDAIEIHTQPGRVREFGQLWQRLSGLIPQLKLVAVSFPDCEDLRDYLTSLLACMHPMPQQLVWQADGRPMSGDIGDGATRAAVLLAKKVIGMQLPFGFVQVAGGTNAITVAKLQAANVRPAGIAYGSYARKLVADILERSSSNYLEDDPLLLQQAVSKAKCLVGQIKHSQSASDLQDATSTFSPIPLKP
ncbi:LdpA C-terminal domain-containing domain [Tumidithrix elongata RA019]|uniref:LdpA C-terminal domain-containing domain n=1 Tax=Tumidithrix elongata BACA0141 TaxID=2716417 RepID=A0AAW9Q450_9CYAN|nr:LdpA C-terminal domain-containing domain [Tumidithrix elongata RA019]